MGRQLAQVLSSVAVLAICLALLAGCGEPQKQPAEFKAASGEAKSTKGGNLGGPPGVPGTRPDMDLKEAEDRAGANTK